MKKRTAQILTVGALTAGALGALSLVAVADAQAPHLAAKGATATVVQAPAVTANCDKQALAQALVEYLGQADRVTVSVTDLPPGFGAWSLGGRIEIDKDTDCAKLPRFIAHELGHELDRASDDRDPQASNRQVERTAECIADRAFVRLYAQDKAPVFCTPAETARAARLAPEWRIR